MRILINGTNCAPEQIGIGKYTGGMAAWFAGRGHEVRVVAAPPYYPAWKIGDGYSSWCYRRESVDGFVIFRCPLWIPARPSGFKRLIHLVSFALSSFPVMLGQLFWRPDVVIVIEPPLMCAPAGWLAARLVGARVWLHIQDFEVDAAFDMGILRSARLRRGVLAIERWLMRQFDCVSTISPKMREKLIDKGMTLARTALFPNWVDLDQIVPRTDDGYLRAELGIPADKLVALYSGNMGEKQGLEVLLEAAKLACSDTRVQFVLCGDGASRQRLQAAYGNLPNVSWCSLQPQDRLNELLGMADVHLLPQRADVADLVMPSKLTGMLASGRPVLATAHAGTQVAEVVARCGVVTPPGDAVALWQALHLLVNASDRRQELGRNARSYAENYLGRDAVLEQFERDLFGIVHAEHSTG